MTLPGAAEGGHPLVTPMPVVVVPGVGVGVGAPCAETWEAKARSNTTKGTHLLMAPGTSLKTITVADTWTLFRARCLPLAGRARAVYSKYP